MSDVHQAREERHQGRVHDSNAEAEAEMWKDEIVHRSGLGDDDGADPDRQHCHHGQAIAADAQGENCEEVGTDEVADTVRNENGSQLPFL